MRHRTRQRGLVVLGAAAALAIVAAFVLWSLVMSSGSREPVEPFRIAGNLHYVGATDASAFLLTGPGGHVRPHRCRAPQVPRPLRVPEVSRPSVDHRPGHGTVFSQCSTADPQVDGQSRPHLSAISAAAHNLLMSPASASGTLSRSRGILIR